MRRPDALSRGGRDPRLLLAEGGAIGPLKLGKGPQTPSGEGLRPGENCSWRRDPRCLLAKRGDLVPAQARGRNTVLSWQRVWTQCPLQQGTGPQIPRGRGRDPRPLQRGTGPHAPPGAEGGHSAAVPARDGTPGPFWARERPRRLLQLCKSTQAPRGGGRGQGAVYRRVQNSRPLLVERRHPVPAASGNYTPNPSWQRDGLRRFIQR